MILKNLSTTGTSRRAELVTRKGVLNTPFFMPDATRGSVRGLGSGDIVGVGIEALVVNTYHLMLQPGASFIRKAGSSPSISKRDVGEGIHSFMHWEKPILSDSGGYQVYSLIHRNPDMGRITEEGAEFKSILDGSMHLLTPERAIEIQFDLGVDMMVCLDDPRPNDAPREDIIAAVDRTLRWAKRCKDEYERQMISRGIAESYRPLLFGVVQGGMIVKERKRCAEGLVAIGFDGYGFGGRHVDSDGNFLEEIVAQTASFIPEDKPRFALGIGTPADIVRSHALGWDMFDCVIPTREGRHGRLFVWNQKNIIPSEVEGSLSHTDSSTRGLAQNDLEEGFYSTLNIYNEQFKEDFTTVDPTCDCELCKNYTRAYLRYLFRVGEPLAPRLASLHNLRFYARLMKHLSQGTL